MIFQHSFIVVKNGKTFYTALPAGFSNEEEMLKSDTANNLGLIVLTGGRPVWPVIRDD